ncbi:unnamed protein product [Linum trigynum]|uniref:Uncharacterized protein n=1 Tax=Linum trigynum TaxID=586398 RepID=A0AAV2D5G1_9ROSI
MSSTLEKSYALEEACTIWAETPILSPLSIQLSDPVAWSSSILGSTVPLHKSTFFPPPSSYYWPSWASSVSPIARTFK